MAKKPRQLTPAERKELTKKLADLTEMLPEYEDGPHLIAANRKPAQAVRADLTSHQPPPTEGHDMPRKNRIKVTSPKGTIDAVINDLIVRLAMADAEHDQQADTAQS